MPTAKKSSTVGIPKFAAEETMQWESSIESEKAQGFAVNDALKSPHQPRIEEEETNPSTSNGVPDEVMFRLLSEYLDDSKEKGAETQSDRDIRTTASDEPLQDNEETTTRAESRGQLAGKKIPGPTRRPTNYPSTDTSTPPAPRRQLNTRDINYGKSRGGFTRPNVVQKDGTIGRKMQPDTHWSEEKIEQQHAKYVERETKRPTTKYPERFICYLLGCGVSANDKSEISRHWNGSTPSIHGAQKYEPAKVFGVVFGDWLKDEDLYCTKNAMCRDDWKELYRAYHDQECETERVDSGAS